MAQSIGYNLNSTFPNFLKSSNIKPICNGRTSVKAMAADHRRDNLDHLQRSAGVKRREVPSAPLGLWDRFPTARTVQQMLETMERMVEDPIAFNTNNNWSSSSSTTIPNNGNGYVRGRTPWEIKEGETDYKMRFDMPGMTKEDVKVWVEQNMLVIKAEKIPKKKHANSHEKNDDQNGAIEIEEEDAGDWPAKSFGKYSSRIALPENIDFEKIKAEVKDGVLYVTVPKSTSRSKIFDINVQ